MDQTVNPCDDFYKFTCGNWHNEHPRPDSATSFDWFDDKRNLVVRNIREFLSSNNPDSENLPKPVRQTQLMYQACMNTEKLDELEIEPVIKQLKRYHLPLIPRIFNLTVGNDTLPKFDWIKTVAIIQREFGGDLMIGFDVVPDPLNRTKNRVVLVPPQPKTLLPL